MLFKDKIIAITGTGTGIGKAIALAAAQWASIMVTDLNERWAIKVVEEIQDKKGTVNSICLGYVRTSMQKREVNWEASLRELSPEAVQNLYIKDTPLGRLETAEDVAKAVIFLSSSLSDFITGVSLSVNGGSYMD